MRHTPLRGIGAMCVAAAAIGLAACGSSSTSATTTTTKTPTTLDATRQSIETFTVTQFQAKGIELDPDCVSKIVAKLTDSDAKILAAAEGNSAGSSPALSPAGLALGTELQTCAPTTAPTSGVTTESTGSTVGPVVTADPALVSAAVDKIFSTPDSAALDRSCIEKNLATQTPELLQVIIDSATDTTDPRLTDLAPLLLDCVSADVVATVAVTATS